MDDTSTHYEALLVRARIGIVGMANVAALQIQCSMLEEAVPALVVGMFVSTVSCSGLTEWP